MEAARSRGEKNRKSITQQVENMKEKLVGRNVQDTARYIELLSPHDREIAALVEEATTARKSILTLPGMKVSAKVRETYQTEQEILRDVASDA
jgi:prophage DNA circulation protein